jgi:hypothetical protein
MNNWIFKAIGFVCTLGFIYIVGSFIAWDYNPLNWWMIRTSIGRLLSIVIFFFIVYGNFIKEYDEDY